jgi:ribosomal protein L22
MTEKNYAPQPKENKKMIIEKTKERIEKTPIRKEEKNSELKNEQEIKKELTDNKKITDSASKSSDSKLKESGDKKELKEKPKTEVKKKEVPKKTEAIVNAMNLPLSTKYSVAICKFIKRKKIEDAISDLEQVLVHKKAIPMKGEIAHRKGKIMSGKYPKKSAEHFIKLLKSLLANANANRLDNPIISDAKANLASRPFGRFGRIRKKRTHVTIEAKEKKLVSKLKNKMEKTKWKKEK